MAPQHRAPRKPLVPLGLEGNHGLNIGVQQRLLASPGVGHLDQSLQYVQGGRLHSVNFWPRGNFSTVGTSHMVNRYIASSAGPSAGRCSFDRCFHPRPRLPPKKRVGLRPRPGLRDLNWDLLQGTRDGIDRSLAKEQLCGF